MKNFRTYQLAVSFYREVEKIKLPSHLRDQLLRASSSIALNLAEGYGKFTTKDRRRFYRISYGSLKECQAILTLTQTNNLTGKADILGAHLYRLCTSLD